MGLQAKMVSKQVEEVRHAEEITSIWEAHPFYILLLDRMMRDCSQFTVICVWNFVKRKA